MIKSAFSYFPSFIYREEKPEWVEATIKLLNRVEAEARDCSFDTQMFQTSLLQNEEVSGMQEHLMFGCVDSLGKEGYDVNSYQYKPALWGQKLYLGGNHFTHVHRDAVMCALYFLETPELGAYPIFSDPRAGKEMGSLRPVFGEEVTPAISDIHFNNIVPGTILYFASWLPHRLNPSQTKDATSFLHFTLSAIEAN